VLPTAPPVSTVASAWVWLVRTKTATAQAVLLWDNTLLANFLRCGLGRRRNGVRPGVDGGWRLTVSDPTQTQSSIRVTVRRNVVDVPLAGAYGATQTVNLAAWRRHR
jgi:hyaluronate lyase